MVIPSIASDPRIEDLKEKLPGRGPGVVHLSGLWGSSAPMAIALVARAAQRTFLYVTAHLEEADHVREDLELFLEHLCPLFPAWETLPGEGALS